MTRAGHDQLRRLGCSVPGAVLLLAATLAGAETPIVQPGKPGEPARALTAEQAINIAVSSYSPADVRFLQDMIPHHQQAVEMAALVAERTNRQELTDAAGRISLSQRDEIEFMKQWLSDRGELVPDPADHAAMHTDHRMAGMATPGQMAELAAATGTDFDRLFLQLMITHHEGAVTMVEELLEQPGAAYDPVLFEFTTDVTNDQTAEIERMHAVLLTLSDDPRAGLKAGFEDAGQAIHNLVLVATLPRPPGFFDPTNPASLPPEQPADPKPGDDESTGAMSRDDTSAEAMSADARIGNVKSADATSAGARSGDDDAAQTTPAQDESKAAPEGGEADDEDGKDDKGWERWPLLSFSNTDMAFRDDILFAGSYHGFNIYRLVGESPQLGSARGHPSQAKSPQLGSARGHPSQAKSPQLGSPRGHPSQAKNPQLGSPAGHPSQAKSPQPRSSRDLPLAAEDHLQQLGSVVCPGGQGDVSVVGDLLIMSVEETRGRLDCGLEGIAEDVSSDRFRGIRIFDVGDLSRPVQVGAVQTCRGSHTHSVVSADDERIVVYNSGTSFVREEEELEGCVDATPGDYRTAHFRIDVIEIPVADPASARIVHSPAVFADVESGTLAGLWRGGDHGDYTQETSATDQCHDITVFPARNIAAGACAGNGILFDISDPLNPTRIDAVVDTGFAYWHSATFNNDGTKLLYTDEWGGGMMPRCRAYDPLDWGANAIYDIVDGKHQFRSYYKMPAPQNEQENCVAHNGSVVPVPGRDILVQAWYQGGISVIDFTDSANPFEIAYFDRGPVDEEHLILGGYWSAYWYDGKIYGTEILRGIDVLSLLPSKFLSANEIAAAALADQGPEFNPQRQQRFIWPDEAPVARAYVDQLVRSNDLDAASQTALNAALDLAAAALQDGAGHSALANRLDSLAASVAADAAPSIAAKRRTGLAGTLRGIAGRLRRL